MQHFQRVDTRLSTMKKRSVFGLKQEAINVQREKRGESTWLIDI